MRNFHWRNNGFLLENYCSRLGTLLEQRYSALALLEAKNQAEKAAIVSNEAMLKAQAADSAKSKFLANMAHELRTPLNAIIGFSEIIHRDNVQAREHYPEYAGYIHSSGTLLLTTIDEMLDFARIETGKIELEEQTVDLDELIRSAITTIQPTAQERSVEIHFNLMQSPAIVRVDRVRFQQILLNLLSNAVKFTKPGGCIEITREFETGGDVLISVSDTGIGISPAQLKKVLEPFEQVEDYLTRENGGTGLGLPIAKSLIELHGGELVLSSDLGMGTTATLRLPSDRVHCLVSSARNENTGGFLASCATAAIR